MAVSELDVSEAMYQELSPMAAAAQAETLAVLERLCRAALEYEDQAAVINAQRAEAIPAHVPAAPTLTTMTLGALNDCIAPLKIDGAGLGWLGFAPVGVSNDELLYPEADRGFMVAAMAEHLKRLA